LQVRYRLAIKSIAGTMRAVRCVHIHIGISLFLLAVVPIASAEPAQTATTTASDQAKEATFNLFSDGWQGKTGFGYMMNQPNLQSGVLQFAEVSLESGGHRFLAATETAAVVRGGNIASTNGVINAGYDFSFFNLKTFIFTNYEFGVISGLTSNTATGLGVRYRFFKNEYAQLDLSLTPTYDRSAYEDGILNEAFSLSGRARAKAFFTENHTLVLAYFYIKGMNIATNQWHAFDAIHNYQISKKVSFRLGYRYRYDVFIETGAGLAYLMAVFNFS